MAEPVYEDNILDRYNLSTYHITFYMLPDGVNPGNYGAINPSNGIIIAESGVTGIMSIESLDTTSYLSISGTNKNTTQTNINFTVREFSGVTLMDKIFAASLDLGIQNYFKVPYYIEVSFKANKSPDASDPTVIPNMTYRWPIKIVRMSASVDAGGATYDIESFHYSDSSNNGIYSNLDKGFSMPSGSTIKDVLTNLETALNERSKEKAATGLTRPDKFKITVNDEIGKMKIVSDIEIMAQSGKTKSFSPDEKDKNELRTVQIEKDTTIIDTINRLVASTDDYQKFIKQSETPDEEGDANKIKRMHRINTDVIPLSYDTGRGDYQREYTFNIIPFMQGSLQVGPGDATAKSTTRFQEYVSNNLISKRYNYIFTGENDQILDFDMSFNFGWYVNMPPQGGFFTNYYTKAEGAVFSDKNAKILEIRRLISSYVKNAAVYDDTVLQAFEESIQSQITAGRNSDNGGFSAEEATVLKRLLSQAKRSRLPEPDDNRSTVDIKTLNSRFVTDYTLENSLKKAKLENKLRMYPLTFAEDNSDKMAHGHNYMQSVEGSKGAGRPYVNSLFQQAFQGKSGDLISVELKIKGDPFWLGEPNKTGALEPVATQTGQPAIIISLRTPEFPQQTHETPNLRSSLLNGLYLVIKVDHSFSGGMFTQTLDCVIDPLINVNEIT